MTTLTLKNPLDMHLHLREGAILQSVLPFSARSFVGGVVMPNLTTPITTAEMAMHYKQEIQHLEASFFPILTIYLAPTLEKTELQKAKKEGINILKLYPKGATTNSQSGISEILDTTTLELLEEAQNQGFILSIHAESNGYSLDREFEFLPYIHEIATQFPHLKIIIEHLSDRRSIPTLERYPNVFATLTLHHITLTLDDLLGKGLNPHLFCKPILKSPKDRDALLHLALNAHPKVSFGSDSAPHLLSKKLSHQGSAGVFSAPSALEQLCSLFERYDALERLQTFVSDNAIKNYDLALPHQYQITLAKTPHTIPQALQHQNDQIIPLNAGQTLQWSIVGKERV
ncbi:dihydroorotase [Helicobacter enhydrae]|uniref:Dihydroorotase n=1 Tax=Helicobacter enhydrae TaxID=222136 RepID=A0A1B1U4H5_9HELI|nr:dihydroorotase [Helicobacter enhydrae]ANV97656.1 dihydroorotase [Helicobacter enhydrae]